MSDDDKPICSVEQENRELKKQVEELKQDKEQLTEKICKMLAGEEET